MEPTACVTCVHHRRRVAAALAGVMPAGRPWTLSMETGVLGLRLPPTRRAF
jgi:hypothetical protein